MLIESCQLTCESAAVPRARDWLAVVLHRRPIPAAAESSVDDATLCVSELVTNALNAGCTALSLCVELSTTTLRVSVFDDARGTPQMRNPDGNDPHGRGLLIINSLATRWGVTQAALGKQVWAELHWPEFEGSG